LQIQVWDTGPGIPDDQLERIFEEFYQLDNSARDRGKGLGLGLAIVDRVARLLDHPIGVRSVPGKGSMFSVLVPLGDEISARASEKASEEPISSGGGLAGRTILVVEDEPEVAEATRHLLEHWGARVVSAADAKHALELVADDRSRPDLIIADYRLSDTATGIDVLREITNSLDAKLPRIILSGDMSSQLHDEAQSLGVPLLHKPVQPAKLRALIHHVMHASA
jgi:CheY-like chemotaxis protein